MTIEKIVKAPEPGFTDEKFDNMVKLLDLLGWDNYRTHYTGEEIDRGEYGDDIYDYSIIVPQHCASIFDFLEEEGLFEFEIR